MVSTDWLGLLNNLTKAFGEKFFMVGVSLFLSIILGISLRLLVVLVQVVQTAGDIIAKKNRYTLMLLAIGTDTK